MKVSVQEAGFRKGKLQVIRSNFATAASRMRRGWVSDARPSLEKASRNAW